MFYKKETYISHFKNFYLNKVLRYYDLNCLFIIHLKFYNFKARTLFKLATYISIVLIEVKLFRIKNKIIVIYFG